MEQSDEITDIEIYIKDVSEAEVLEWLKQTFIDLKPGKRNKQGLKLNAVYQETILPIMVLEKVTGPFSCIWINSTEGPWQNDESFAEAAWQHFNHPVRFSREGWSKGDDPDMWWQRDADGLSQIHWPDA